MDTLTPPIDAGLVARLLAEQFPQWGGLPVRPVDEDGWDNRSFRVGEHLVARLPSAAGYELQVGKEARWLPILRPVLTQPVPEVLAVGRPGCGYPFAWSVRRWITGVPASSAGVSDPEELADALAAFLAELRAVDPHGPGPGDHCAWRGAPLNRFDDDVRGAVRSLADAAGRTACRTSGGVPLLPAFDPAAALRVWEEALDAADDQPGVWFHGDLAPGNLLLRDGRLSAVIDFGCSGVGDPACDLAIMWTSFGPSERRRFRERLDVTQEEWSRGRGWALWKALITVADPRQGSQARRTLRSLDVVRA